MEPRVLFVLKYRDLANGSPGEYETSVNCDPTTHPHHPNGYGLSSGLLNSARFVKEMLVDHGVEAKLVQVLDNNFIDREVHKFKPTHCIIEAYWVVPEKFDILQKLHPNVTWIIRNHSELPFLANEGNAMDWTLKYVEHPNVIVSGNSPVVNEEMRFVIKMAHPDWTDEQVAAKCVYLPNYYKITEMSARRLRDPNDDYLDIACFGAVRPLKNHLLQAVAAMKFATKMRKKLRFHINTGRVETKGDPVLKNVRKLFEHMPQHQLVEHEWMTHAEFIKLVRTMDMGIQVSFTETFNIVTADFVDQSVPVVVSDEVWWVDPQFHANPTDSDDICAKMEHAWFTGNDISSFNPNKRLLRRYLRDSEKAWLGYLNEDQK